MSDIWVNIAVVALAGFIHATLQLGLGCVILLYHGSVGRAHIRRKTNSLVSSFISGVGLMSFLLLSAVAFILLNIFGLFVPDYFLAVGVGMLAATAVATILFYYRRGVGTELWLPKPVAKFIDQRAKATNNTSEAYLLGSFACFGELPFILALLLISGACIVELPVEWQLLAVAIYAIISIIPLVIFRFSVHTGKTVADVQKWRMHFKRFLKIISTVSYLALTLFVIVYKIIEV
ncbi:MAG: hypothetical protein LBQ02_00075 [Candidatus Nomurabacteria bacterium]|jgi:hypothetical protein|nr:hypothetical protein [Candidatus Nomurabacteria bacterium]